MATIYMDSRSLSGKEDGSKEHPFKTFDFAYNKAKDHDTIWDLEPKVVKLSKDRQKNKKKIKLPIITTKTGTLRGRGWLW